MAFGPCCLCQKPTAVHSASLRMPSRTKCFEDPADDFSFDSHWFCRWTLPVYSTLLSPNRPFPKLSPFRGLIAFQPNHFKNVLRFYGCLNIWEIILFVQTPTLPWCRPESPDGLFLRSTKNASSFPPLPPFSRNSDLPTEHQSFRSASP
jgi:hypothetical protein